MLADLKRVYSEPGEPVTTEYRIRTTDDEWVWFEHRAHNYLGEEPIDGILVSARPIEARKHTEQQLRDERRFITQALDALPDSFLVFDEEWTLQRWNETVAAVTGYDDEQLDGMPIEAFHPPEYHDLIAGLETTLRTEESLQVEADLLTADGDRIPHEFTAAELSGDDGETRAYVGIGRDITDRRAYERKLERQTEELETLTAELERQYRHLFEEAPIMMVLTRIEDGEPVIDDCNQQFADRLGYDKTDVIDRELATFYTDDSTRRLLEEGGYHRALSGAFVREERDLIAADGEHVETLLRAVPRQDPGDDTTGTLAMYVDVSERKAIEREKTRLEEVTRVLSHDLRNPLNVAKGRAELAATESDTEDLAVVLDALDRMEALIEDLLTLARSGEDVREEQPLSLAELSQHAWQNVETPDATLQIDASDQICGEQTRVAQLFENLFRNAIEHGSDGVTVTVGELDDGFYVEDTGPGIPAEDRERVFEAGYSTNQDGTGFGLGIVKQVCDAHGWDIEVVAGADGGARFVIEGVRSPIE